MPEEAELHIFRKFLDSNCYYKRKNRESIWIFIAVGLTMVKRISQLQNDGQVEQDKFRFFADKFAEALCDDLNTSNAVSVIYDVLNSDANDKTKYELIKSFDEVLSLDLMKKAVLLKRDSNDRTGKDTRHSSKISSIFFELDFVLV